jgi:hypothetical protein
MSPIPPSLSNIPWVVQEILLELLDQRTLAALSATSTSFHHVAKYHLHRNLICYEKHRKLVEGTLRRDPSIIRCIRSFTCYNGSLLRWMWSYPTHFLTELELELKWSGRVDYFSETFDNDGPKTQIKRLTLGGEWYLQVYLLGDLYQFRTLTSLKLRLPAPTGCTLQRIFEELYAPVLESLEVERVSDWRLDWRMVAGNAFPKLRGLYITIPITGEDGEMCDTDDDAWNPERLPLSNIMWNTVLSLQQRNIYFDVSYEGCDDDDPFIEEAPSYAAREQLDPIPLVQWLVKSRIYFRTQRKFQWSFVTVAKIPTVELLTILRAIQPLDIGGHLLHLSMHLTTLTPLPFARLLPQSLFHLTITPHCLDASVIPDCIRSLSNLRILSICFNAALAATCSPNNNCTNARLVFPPVITENRGLNDMYITISRSGESVWYTYVRDEEGEFEDVDGKFKRITGTYPAGEFEMEVQGWYELSTSLRRVDITIETETG